MPLTPEEELMVDHQKARDYIDTYKTAVTNAFIARVAILNGATQDFNSFLNLPPESNSASAIWDVAFAVVSMAVPALRLGTFLKAAHDRADIALKAAETFGRQARRADKAIKVGTQIADLGGKGGTYVNQVKDIIEKAEKVRPELKGQVDGHVSRGPIRELIKDLNEAPKAWEKAIETETKEWENRLADLKTQGTLQNKVKEILTLPEVLDEDEIWNLYLFEMVIAHCRREVYWEREIIWSNMGGVKQGDISLKGLNGNQIKQILEWFGASAKRGKYFDRPLIWNISVFLALCGSIPTKQKMVALAR